MPIAKCASCKRKFRQNEETGDTCRFCRADQREADREARAAETMSLLVFGTNDPDSLVEDDRNRNV